MKKYLISLAALLLLIIACLSFTSCADHINAPPSLNFDMDTQTLRWGKVPDAYSYEVRISGSETVQTVRTNQIILEYLEPGSYIIAVRTLPRNPELQPSEWVEFSLEKPTESGLRYKLINNRTEYELIGAGTASGDVVMESIYRGKPVTSIAEKAFANNTKITSLVVGEHVKTIGKNAFTRCSALVSVTLPDGLTSLGEYAFQSCKSLKTVNIPASMTEIAPYTFSWCSSLETVPVEGQIVSVGEYAFSNCTLLTSISFTDSLKTVGDYAFSDCEAITLVSLGKSATDIGEYAFANCFALTDLTLGESLVNIGDYAFMACGGIEELALPLTLESIGHEAFRDCAKLTEVTIGENLRKIGKDAFFGTALKADDDGIYYLGGWVLGVVDPNAVTAFLPKEGTYGLADYAFAYCKNVKNATLSGIKYIGYASFGGCEKLEDIGFDNALIELGDYAFASCPKLKGVYFYHPKKDTDEPSRLTRIGSFAFYECSTLYDVDLPDSLTSIGSYAFNKTKAYETAQLIVYMDDWVVSAKNTIHNGVLIKDGIRGIADYSFYNAIVIGGVQIADSVEYIGRSAFYNQTMTGATLPASLKRIGDYAFYGCIGVRFAEDRVTMIPEGTEYIGRSAFYGCEAMAGFVIPGSVKEIGPYAFYGCTGLGRTTDPETEVTVYHPTILNEGIVSIGDRAFQGCTGITEIVIPDSVTQFGIRVFYKCEGLTKVTVGSGIVNIPNYSFYKCALLEEAIISDGVESIGDYAFRGCEKLTKVTLGSSIKTIGKYAFYGCALESIILPEGLTTVGNYAFRGCSDAIFVTVPKSVEYVGRHAFYGLDNATIFCEAESIPPYFQERWNSSYRTVIWGCTLSPEGYPVSFTVSEDTVENVSDNITVIAATREGYVFLGWAVSENGKDIAYTAENAVTAPNGTVLWSVWEEATITEEGTENEQ